MPKASSRGRVSKKLTWRRLSLMVLAEVDLPDHHLTDLIPEVESVELYLRAFHVLTTGEKGLEILNAWHDLDPVLRE